MAVTTWLSFVHIPVVYFDKITLAVAAALLISTLA